MLCDDSPVLYIRRTLYIRRGLNILHEGCQPLRLNTLVLQKCILKTFQISIEIRIWSCIVLFYSIMAKLLNIQLTFAALCLIV